MPAEFKVAVVGCGKQAPKHISGLRGIPGVEIVLADAMPESARSLAQREGLAWIEHPEEVFADPSIDAVDFCTPTATHLPLIRAAIANGKDFFCEKPLCENAAQGRQIAAELQHAKRIGMVGYTYRFAPVFELGQRLLQDVSRTSSSRVLGPVRLAHFRIGGRGSHQLWKHRRASGGGAANEMLVHMLDLAIWYFGPVVEARLLTQKLLRGCRKIQGRRQRVDAEDLIVAELLMASGTTVLCQADMLTPAFTQYVEIQGDNGTFMGSIDPALPSFVFCSDAIDEWAAGRTPLQFGPVNLFEAQMQEFVRAVRMREEPRRGRVADSVRLLEAMEMLKAGSQDA